jgi:hypothetical protein
MGGNPEAARGSAVGGLGKTVPGRRTSEGCRASVLDHFRGSISAEASCLVVLVLVLVQALALVGNLLSCWRGMRERGALFHFPASSSGKGKGKNEKRKGKRGRDLPPPLPFLTCDLARLGSGEDRAGKPGQSFPPSAGISGLCLTLILAEIAARREGSSGLEEEALRSMGTVQSPVVVL